MNRNQAAAAPTSDFELFLWSQPTSASPSGEGREALLYACDPSPLVVYPQVPIGDSPLLAPAPSLSSSDVNRRGFDRLGPLQQRQSVLLPCHEPGPARLFNEPPASSSATIQPILGWIAPMDSDPQITVFLRASTAQRLLRPDQPAPLLIADSPSTASLSASQGPSPGDPIQLSPDQASLTSSTRTCTLRCDRTCLALTARYNPGQ